jgi:Heavy metal associated domain 2
VSYYFHSVPGRLRVRCPRLKGDRRAAAALRRLLRRLVGVTAVAVNHVTGSVLVHYRLEQVSHTDLLAILSDAGHFDTAQAVTQDEYIRAAVSRAGWAIGRALIKHAVEHALGPVPLAVLADLVLADARRT